VKAQRITGDLHKLRIFCRPDADPDRWILLPLYAIELVYNLGILRSIASAKLQD
jgi:hypothetical protein